MRRLNFFPRQLARNGTEIVLELVLQGAAQRDNRVADDPFLFSHYLVPRHPSGARATLELIVNLKTAKTLGLALSPTLHATADDVIE